MAVVLSAIQKDLTRFVANIFIAMIAYYEQSNALVANFLVGQPQSIRT
jgi:hypothetical protein